MKKRIKVYIILIILTGILLGGFLLWKNDQKVERKYQACLEKCGVDYCGFKNVLIDKDESCLGCKAECREKYAK